MLNIGYGAGNKDFDFPNILRVIQFEITNQQLVSDQVQIIECQIDDMTPEMLGDFMEGALEQGVLDIFYTPITMKNIVLPLKLQLFVILMTRHVLKITYSLIPLH